MGGKRLRTFQILMGVQDVSNYNQNGSRLDEKYEHGRFNLDQSCSF